MVSLIKITIVQRVETETFSFLGFTDEQKVQKNSVCLKPNLIINVFNVILD